MFEPRAGMGVELYGVIDAMADPAGGALATGGKGFIGLALAPAAEANQ